MDFWKLSTSWEKHFTSAKTSSAGILNWKMKIFQVSLLYTLLVEQIEKRRGCESSHGSRRAERVVTYESST